MSQLLHQYSDCNWSASGELECHGQINHQIMGSELHSSPKCKIGGDSESNLSTDNYSTYFFVIAWEHLF